MGQEQHTIDKVFALALFCAFAASVLLVLVIGARVYKNTVKTMEERYTQNTCLSYIASKLHHYDASDSIHIESFGDANALVLEERIGDTDYTTFIYSDKGCVRELMTEKGLGLLPEDGEMVIDGMKVDFQQVSDNLIKAVCTENGGQASYMFININSSTQEEKHE